MIEPLEQPDIFYLQSAEGWLELGNATESKQELEKISPLGRRHCSVLSMGWHVQAVAGDWEAALDIAATITELTPENINGWVQQAWSFHKLKRTEDARQLLLKVLERFSQSAALHYNLACCECQLGRPAIAKTSLENALTLAKGKQLKLAALNDPDLEPLWGEFGK